LYTAPASPPNPNGVTVTATSQADGTKSATAAVTLAGGIVVTVSPASLAMNVNQQQVFTANVSGTGNTAVTWSVSGADCTGSGCSGSACGTIPSTGLYTAPAAAPNPSSVTIRATSQADPNSASVAGVTINPGVAVGVSPTSVSVRAGATQQFTPTVTGSSN